MGALQIEQAAGKVLMQLPDNFFQRNYAFADLLFLAQQLVRLYPLGGFLLTPHQQLAALNPFGNVLDSPQHFLVQIIVVDIVIVPALLGIAVMVGAAYQRRRPYPSAVSSSASYGGRTRRRRQGL